MDHIVRELNDQPQAAINYLKYIHTYLSKIASYNQTWYASAIEDLYEDFEFGSLSRGEWGGNILSDSTIEKIGVFESEWKEYRETTPYGEDYVFVYFDTTWHKLVQEKLVPALFSIESDFSLSKIECESYRDSYQPDNRPKSQDILSRATILYNLLKTHKSDD